jgi:hypothetical protein
MRYYIGAVLRPVSNWEDFIEIKAPKHYKDPKKIAQYIVERRAEIELDAVTHPLGGHVSSICVLVSKDGSVDSENMYKQDGDGCGRGALEWILNHSGLIVDSTLLSSIFVGGCRLAATLRFMAIEYMLATGSLPFSLHWMLDSPALQAKSPLVVDPARAICGYRGPPFPEISFDKVAKKFGLPAPNEDDAESMAVFAVQLCTRLGM